MADRPVLTAERRQSAEAQSWVSRSQERAVVGCCKEDTLRASPTQLGVSEKQGHSKFTIGHKNQQNQYEQ